MYQRLAPRVLLVGWDAADWQIIRPLVNQGLMPNFRRLAERGAHGTISSLQPMQSPVLWTSIATGKRPYKHGIHGLSERNPEVGGIRLASSTRRMTKALWNILTQNHMTSHVIGWRGAHPAEPIRGINVTDLHAEATVEFGKPWRRPDGSFHPIELGPTLAALRIHPHELDRESLAFFVPNLTTIGMRDIQRLSECAKGLAATVTNHAVATWAMEHYPWELMAICYSGIEYFSHHFMKYAPPRQESVSAEEFALYQHVVTACYRFHDLMLGRLIELAGTETTVVLISDHGYKTGAMRPTTSGHGAQDIERCHRPVGVCVVHGPHIKPGSTIRGASILDVAPTILALFGVPLGIDVDGKPWLDLLDVETQPEHIASWDTARGESGMHPPASVQPQQQLQQMLEQLRGMGYKDPREEQLSAIEKRVEAENRLNLARSLIEGGELSQAIELLDGLAATSLLSQAVGAILVEAYLLSDRREDAQGVIDRLLPEHADTPLVNMTQGRINLGLRRPDAALEHLLRAEAKGADNPRLHVFIGRAYLALRRWQDARRAFQRALELEPDHAEALHGMCIVCLRESNARLAAEYGRAAINAFEPMADAHYHLAVALTRLGHNSQASSAFEQALSLNPNLRAARRLLIRLYDDVLNEPMRAAEHRRAGEQLHIELRDARGPNTTGAEKA